MKTAARVLGFAIFALAVSFGVVGLHLGPDLRHVVFARPEWGLLTVVPLLALAWRTYWSPRPATLRFSRARSLRRASRGFVTRLADVPDGLRLAAAVLLVGALARPQSSRTTDRLHHEGIDIVIALDLSQSMETMDMYPNRLGAAQLVIDAFISRRPHDRIGLVAFGSSASTVAPLTMDHDVLRALVKRLRLGVIDGTRTAIGAGVGVALNRLDDSEAESKVLVLLTDGVHNAEGLDPDSAAAEASERGVMVYTILMGQHGTAGPQSVDPGRLERMASVTGGYAYTAEDQNALQTSFQDLLNKLERSTIEGEQVRAELFHVLLWPALFLVLLDVLLRSTRLRRFP